MQGKHNVVVFGVRRDRRNQGISAVAGKINLAVAEIVTATPFGFNGYNTLYQCNRSYANAKNVYTPGAPFVLDAEKRNSQTVDPFWEAVHGGKNDWTRPSPADEAYFVAAARNLLVGAIGQALPVLTGPKFFGKFNLAGVAALDIHRGRLLRWAYDQAQALRIQDIDDVIGIPEATDTIELVGPSGTEETHWSTLFSDYSWEMLEAQLEKFQAGDGSRIQNLCMALRDYAIQVSSEGGGSPIGFVPLEILNSTRGISDLFVELQELAAYEMDASLGDYQKLAESFTNSAHPAASPTYNTALVRTIPNVLGWQLFNGVGRSKTNAASIRASRMQRGSQAQARRGGDRLVTVSETPVETSAGSGMKGGLE